MNNRKEDKNDDLRIKNAAATAAMATLVAGLMIVAIKISFFLIKHIVRMIPPTFRLLRDVVISAKNGMKHSDEDISMEDAARLNRSKINVIVKPVGWYVRHVVKAGDDISKSEARSWFMLIGCLIVILITPEEARYGAIIFAGLGSFVYMVNIIKIRYQAYQDKTK